MTKLRSGFIITLNNLNNIKSLNGKYGIVLENAPLLNKQMSESSSIPDPQTSIRIAIRISSKDAIKTSNIINIAVKNCILGPPIGLNVVVFHPSYTGEVGKVIAADPTTGECIVRLNGLNHEELKMDPCSYLPEDIVKYTTNQFEMIGQSRNHIRQLYFKGQKEEALYIAKNSLKNQLKNYKELYELGRIHSAAASIYERLELLRWQGDIAMDLENPILAHSSYKEALDLIDPIQSPKIVELLNLLHESSLHGCLLVQSLIHLGYGRVLMQHPNLCQKDDDIISHLKEAQNKALECEDIQAEIMAIKALCSFVLCTPQYQNTIENALHIMHDTEKRLTHLVNTKRGTYDSTNTDYGDIYEGLRIDIMTIIPTLCGTLNRFDDCVKTSQKVLQFIEDKSALKKTSMYHQYDFLTIKILFNLVSQLRNCTDSTYDGIAVNSLNKLFYLVFYNSNESKTVQCCKCHEALPKKFISVHDARLFTCIKHACHIKCQKDPEKLGECPICLNNPAH